MVLPPMTTLPSDRSEAGFGDYKPAYSPAQALAEANRCLYCVDAPCVQHCPTGIDIPGFIRKISTGNLRGSARTIFDANVFGMSCARVCPVEVLCAGACVYNHLDSPAIEIGKLQRYATDAAYAEGWEFFTAGPDSGKSVGLIGGGPAALAAAHELRVLGHACTIYDAGGVLGGLNTTGVAPYKMRADQSLAEVEWVLRIGGIAVESGVQVGRDVSWEELQRRHDALVIAVGLGVDRRLEIPGKDLAGIHGAVDFIRLFKLGRVDLSKVHRAAVLGGGNTAIDAVRELRGLGVAEVTMIYRGAEANMSGYVHEWKAAKVDGVRGSFHSQPVAYVGEGGQVRGVRCARIGRDRRPTGEEFTVAADLVLLAIGQARLGEFAAGLAGVVVEDGRIVVDAQQATGRRGVYAAGDCANGGMEVVNAVAEGKRAARSIDALLRGGHDHG
ncbi:MAG: FAD-dependent oxidoreductase [Myxococcales bacterium]|nr:FAD-dependent oxidoreductase [Myxococcales bacterium]